MSTCCLSSDSKNVCMSSVRAKNVSLGGYLQGEEFNVCYGGFTDEFSSWKHSHFHGVRDPSSLHFQTLPRSTFPSSNGDSREDKFRPFLNPSLRAPARLSFPFARHGLVKKNPRGGQLAHDDPRDAIAVLGG